MRIAITAIVFLVLISAHSTHARDISYSLGTGFGLRSFDVTQTTDIANSDTLTTLNADYFSINLNAAAAIDNFFTRLEYETSLQDDTTFSDSEGRDPRFSPVEIGRDDYTFTLGWYAWQNLSVSMGYKYGDSRGKSFGEGVDSNNGEFIDSIRTTQFIQSGPFLGVGYNIIFDELGVLSLSYAYALFEGQYSEEGNTFIRDIPDANDPDTLTRLARGDLVNEGSSHGNSISIAWQGRINQLAAYFVQFRYQDYNYDTNMDINISAYTLNNGQLIHVDQSVETGKSNYHEQISGVYFGLNWYL